MPAPESTDPRVIYLQHKSVAEPSIHFWRNFLPASKMLGRVDYMGCSERSKLAAWIQKRG